MGGFVKIDNDDLKFGKIVSYEVATKLKENIDLFAVMVPVGEVVPILTGIVGVPTPDPNFWQECNGTEIVNENSPLRTVGGIQKFTPDMRGYYLKVPQAFGESGQNGGYNDNWIFRHSHGGNTGVHEAPPAGDPGGNQFMTHPFHAHTIAYVFNYAMNVEPPYYTLRWFMRIQ